MFSSNLTEYHLFPNLAMISCGTSKPICWLALLYLPHILISPLYIFLNLFLSLLWFLGKSFKSILHFTVTSSAISILDLNLCIIILIPIIIFSIFKIYTCFWSFFYSLLYLIHVNNAFCIYLLYILELIISLLRVIVALFCCVLFGLTLDQRACCFAIL